MNLQVRKLNAIEYIIGLKDKKIFDKIELAILESQQEGMKPFSQKQLVERAKRADKDYLSGNFKTQEQIESESGNW